MDLQQNVCMQPRDKHTQGVFLLLHMSVVYGNTEAHQPTFYYIYLSLEILFVCIRVRMCRLVLQNDVCLLGIYVNFIQFFCVSPFFLI